MGCPEYLGSLRPLLKWTILTAATIGPGTVTMCAKSGADTKQALLWCVLVASAVAWILQEASARLTLLSGGSLGDCARTKLPRGGLAVLRRLLAAFVVFGGLSYEANNFAGTMSAVRMLVDDERARYAANLLLAPLCLLLLALGTGQTAARTQDLVGSIGLTA